MIKKLLCICLSVFGFATVSDAQVVSTIAGNGTAAYSGDGGPATNASIKGVTGVAVDGAGNVYIADWSNNRVRMINTLGVMSTIAGDGTAGFGGDGGPATDAQLNQPMSVAVDAAGNIYIADEINTRVRMVNTSGIISTVAGEGTYGFSGDGGPATDASLYHPSGVAVDVAGNLYICDATNSRIRKVNTSGIISTIAGNGSYGFSGDGGPATAASLYPIGVAVDNAGNVYIADRDNYRVRKVNTSGIISTIAGVSTYGYNGDGIDATTAQLNLPDGVAVDGAGNVYVADFYNTRVRKISTGGIITTVAGTGVENFSGDGGPATAAEFRNPEAVAFDASGNMYIADYFNYRIRKVTNSYHYPVFASGNTQTFTVCEDAPATPVNAILAVNDTNVGLTESWSVVTPPAHGTLAATYSTTSTGSPLIPTGLTFTPTPGYSGLDTFVVRVYNGLSDDTTHVYVTINPLPDAGSISGSTTVCQAGTTTLTDAAPGGVWSASNGTATVSGGVVTGVAGGVDTISYTVTNSCGTDVATYVITVNPLPDPGVVTGPSTVCLGTTITLADTATAGVWSVSNGNATINSLGELTGVTQGTDTVSYTLTNGCGSSSATAVITILDPVPDAGTISGASFVCVGSSMTLTSTSPGGTWSAVNTNANVSAGVVYGLTPGMDTINYTVTNTCGTAMASHVMTVIPVPVVGPITGPGVVCPGSTITLSNAYSGGIWNTTNANAFVSGGIVYGVTPGIDTVTYSIINSCGVATATRTIVINALPAAAAISGASTVCQSATITLTDAVTGGTWSAANINAVVSASGVVTGVTAGVDTITYTVTNICGSDAATKVITVNPLPDAGTISGPAYVCIGSTVTLTASAGGFWSMINSTAISLGGGVFMGIHTGIDTIVHSVSNSCGTTTSIRTLEVDSMANAGTLSGPSTVCVGDTITLTPSVAGGVWSVAGGAATVSGGEVIGVVTGTSHISYGVTNVCGTTYVSRFVTVNPLPVAGVISGPSTVCVGALVTMSSTASGGTFSVVNPHLNITSTGIGLGLTAGVDTVQYSVANVCGTAVADYVVTVNPAPEAGVMMGVDSLCYNSTTTLTITATSDTNGTWLSSAPAVATVDTTGLVSGVSPGMSDIMYVVSNSCGADTVLMTVFVDTTAQSITGPDSVCIGDLITLSNPDGGIWTTSNALIANVSSLGEVLGVSAGSATISFALTNGCGTTYATHTVWVKTHAQCNVGVLNNNANSGELVVFPNPNTGTFTINLPSVAGKARVVVSSVTGARVKELMLDSGSTATVNLDVAAGVYMIAAYTDEGVYTSRIVVDR